MSENKPLTLEEQIYSLKKITAMTGAVHEAQTTQLKNWSLMIPGIKGVEIRIDTEIKQITFVLIPATNVLGKSKFKKTTKAVSMMFHVHKWASDILWDNLVTFFKVNDVVVLHSNPYKLEQFMKEEANVGK